MGNNRTRSKGKRKDISLMTLLANEATSDSRKLLKKYGQQDAADYDDLEVKLADLYFKTDDKMKLEKELAEIHPHKKWILKYVQPPVEVKKEEVIVAVEPKKEEKSNADGSPCMCPRCQMMSGCCGDTYSRADGTNDKSMRPMDYIGVIGMVAVVGALFYVMSKTSKA